MYSHNLISATVESSCPDVETLKSRLAELELGKYQDQGIINYVYLKLFQMPSVNNLLLLFTINPVFLPDVTTWSTLKQLRVS